MSPANLERRRFLRRGVVGGALLLAAGTGSVALWPSRKTAATPPGLRLLDATEYAILSAVAARMVPGDDAGPLWPPAADLRCAEAIDALMAQVDPDIGKDFRRLLRLFENGATGLMLGRRPVPFTRCNAEEQDRRIEGWRDSRVTLLKSGYHALKRLCHATYYGSPAVYARVGYPGPPTVPAGAEPTEAPMGAPAAQPRPDPAGGG